MSYYWTITKPTTMLFQLHFYDPSATELAIMTFDMENMSTYLNGTDVVFQTVKDAKLMIPIFDISNLVGATAIARYNYMVNTFIDT